jgi:hypothetical protein
MTPNPHREAGAQFTPGPWEWWDDGESLVRITEASEQKLVCKTVLPSNARLIAAAPSLYEALEAFVDKIDHACLVEHDCRDSHLADELRSALAALAKARGESA